MEVILLEKVGNLGNLGAKVRVKSGYGRNYLIPKGKAVPATKPNIEKFESQRAELELAQADVIGKATARAESFAGLSITLKRKAGPEGKLYGSVGTVDISQAVTETGIVLEKNEVRLPDGPFRHIGEFDVEVNLHADITASIRLNIVPEED
ncbi:MAG: large subunit ribosomal protein L9 [Gammaproteobacteria bacterium]|jgi:large subunit ribosomal protein L9